MELRINLIPDYRKEEIRRSKRWRLVLRLGLALFFIAAAFFAVLLGFGYVLESELQVVASGSKAETDRDQHKLIIGYDERFRKINEQVSDIIVMENSQIYWSRLLENISREIIPGIRMGSLSTKNYAVFMAGEADNRDNLISFKEKLEKNDCFAEINLPLSNLVSRENIVFQMDLRVKEECIHSQNK
ncbi:MAG: hypothetical protein QG620_743 [Patescibacteria group bacterium]|nr:hypothetical protein [Patescibacteria group bacterium]